MKNILITGISTGIGYSCAEVFIKKGYRVFGSVRKLSDSEKLKDEFGENLIPLLFDVTDQIAIDKSYEYVKDYLDKTNEGLDCLINNSGIAEGGPLLHMPITQIEKHFDINVIGLLRVTKTFLPLLGAQKNYKYKSGKIINIGSVSGKIGSPMAGAYVGSKHALEGISHSLRRELLIYGIDVIIIGLGPVITPIWDKGINIEPYLATDYKESLKLTEAYVRNSSMNGFSSEKVANDILKIFENTRPKVRYAIVPNYLTNWLLPRLIPHRIIDKIIGKALKLTK